MAVSPCGTSRVGARVGRAVEGEEQEDRVIDPRVHGPRVGGCRGVARGEEEKGNEAES